MKKKTILIIGLSLLCIVILASSIGLFHMFSTTVKGDYDNLKVEFAAKSSLKQSQLINLEYEAIFPSALDAIDNGQYGLYVAVNEETKDRAEMGIIKRTNISDLFGRAWIVDYAVSENSVGSYLMTDESGNGQYLIFYSANYERIDRAEIKYKNAVDTEIDKDINPNFPLRYVISGLGTTENSTKQIEYVVFYSDADEIVYEYKPA